MKYFAWTTDTHLNLLTERDYGEYFEYLAELNPEALLITGDIAEGEFLDKSLFDFKNKLNFPVYFVLGNHDFYFTGFEEREKKLRQIVKNSENLFWLTEAGIIPLNEKTALVGVEGWGDGRHGTLNLSEGASRDVLRIQDYRGLSREEFGFFLHKMGDKYASILRSVLPEALKKYPKVILATHVPPFVEVCFGRDLRICGEYKLPFYTCKAIGDFLLETAEENPNCQITVLCGHTHEKAEAQIRENLLVRVKESGYGSWWEATMIGIN
ncbi:MAG: metallophosphoesterase [Pyrinomonadaceae bacterium]